MWLTFWASLGLLVLVVAYLGLTKGILPLIEGTTPLNADIKADNSGDFNAKT